MLHSVLASSESQYAILPTSQDGQPGRMSLSYRASRMLKRRGNGVILGVLLISFVFTAVYLVNSTRTDAEDAHTSLLSNPETLAPALPPLYPEWHKEELALPQHHDVHNAFAGGRKYMWVADHTQCASVQCWCSFSCSLPRSL